MAGAQGHVGRGFASSLFGLPQVDATSWRCAITQWCSLNDWASLSLPRRYGQYSVRYLEKVSLARALMGNPHCSCWTTGVGLDESELDELAQLIVELRESMSVLLVEHNMDFVMPLVIARGP